MVDICQSIKTLGIVFTNIPQKNASFIMSDGSFLSLHENRYLVSRGFNKEATHNDFCLFLMKRGLLTTRDQDNFLDTCNAIRLNTGDYVYNHEQTFIDLPLKPLSNEQYKSLLLWLDYVCFELKKDVLFLGSNHQHKNKTIYLSNGLMPEEIIKEIKKIYASSN